MISPSTNDATNAPMVTVMVSAFLTYLATFEIARHLASDWVKRKIESVPNAERIMEAVEEEGFKLVVLLRMNPFVPAIIKGFGFGTTSLRLSTYLIGSMIGSLPILLAHVYLGWAGGAAMLSAAAQPTSLQTGLLVGGLIVSLILVAFVFWFSKRALNRRTLPEGQAG